ncbi:hypothetical protein DOT_4487 [Desulfosporosinus sp. OT]|nr:hypothetical protein DOT_4487 [Desulfosporosinus sp. OT]
MEGPFSPACKKVNACEGRVFGCQPSFFSSILEKIKSMVMKIDNPSCQQICTCIH